MNTILTHTALEFKRNEVATLQYIQNRGIFYGDFNELASAIEVAYSRYSSSRYKSGKKDFDFSFVSDFDMEIEQQNHRIVLHATVNGNYDFMTYSFGISDIKNPSELIRRFHFDYDHTKIRKKQKAFISHLQYGGKCGPSFSGMQYGTNTIEHGLSEPRLNFPPINLALLFDIVFCEFQNETTNKIIEDPDWRSLIKKNETFVLKKYFNSISNHIDSAHHNKDTLVRDICYAKS